MATPVYGWNPFQMRSDCRVENEVIKTSGDNDRRVFVVRAGPFFSTAPIGSNGKKFIVRRQGSNAELIMGTDYAFAHPFDRFINKYKRNAWGAIVLLKPFPNEVLLADYDTIGGPFILDDVAFATLVANIANSPRTADWDDVSGVPYDFPADPHEQPEWQTYDYIEFMQSVRSLVMIATNQAEQANALQLLEQHMRSPLPEAHPANKGSIGLPDVGNLRPSVMADLAGSSANVAITADVLKEAFRRFRLGQLDLD